MATSRKANSKPAPEAKAPTAKQRDAARAKVLKSFASKDGSTLLHQAAELGDDIQVRMQLAEGCPPTAVAKTTKATPLHALAASEQPLMSHTLVKIAELLLLYGSDPLAPDATGATPLALAAGREPEAPELVGLLASWADPAAMFAPDKTGRNPLHRAAAAHSATALTVLLARGRTGSLPALIAALDGRIKATGQTPLHLSEPLTHFPVYETLFRAGADPFLLDKRKSVAFPNPSDDRGPALESATDAYVAARIGASAPSSFGNGSSCFKCGTSFSMFGGARKKTHCIGCGHTFCSSHAPTCLSVPSFGTKPGSVCEACASIRIPAGPLVAAPSDEFDVTAPGEKAPPFSAVVAEDQQLMLPISRAVTCFLCYDRLCDTKVEPCGHAYTCFPCGNHLRACLACRAPVSHASQTRVYEDNAGSGNGIGAVRKKSRKSSANSDFRKVRKKSFKRNVSRGKRKSISSRGSRKSKGGRRRRSSKSPARAPVQGQISKEAESWEDEAPPVPENAPKAPPGTGSAAPSKSPGSLRRLQSYASRRIRNLSPWRKRATGAEDQDLLAWIEHVNFVLGPDPDLAAKLPILGSAEALRKATLDGLVFCKLINVSFPNTIETAALNTNTTELDMVMVKENHTLAIENARALGAKIGFISAKDLEEGDYDSVVEFLWQIIKLGLYERLHGAKAKVAASLRGSDESDAVWDDLPPDVLLTRWANSTLPPDSGLAVTNFAADLKDSVIYINLLAALDSSKGDLKLAKISNLTTRAAKMLALAPRFTQITYATPDSIVAENDRLNFAFLASLFLSSVHS